MADKIYLLDRIMSSGKSTAVLDYIDNSPSNEKFIFVAPLLSEIEDVYDLDGNVKIESRLKKLKNRKFLTPDTNGRSKSESIKELLSIGADIATTHSLYTLLSDDCLDYIKQHNYQVLIDEEIDLISPYQYASKSDLLSLLNDNKVEINPDNGNITWIADDKITAPYKKRDHKHNQFYNAIVNGCIYCSKTKYGADGEIENTFMVSQLTDKLIRCAKRVIILSFLYKGGILDSFLRLKGITCVPFEDVEVTPKPISYFRNLITLVPPRKDIRGMSMSYGWYYGEAKKDDINKISNYIRSVCLKYANSPKDVLWTCPSNYVENNSNRQLDIADIDVVSKRKKPPAYIKPKGYYIDVATGENLWLACGTKATNMYKEKTVMVHCIDRYPNLSVETYLSSYGFPVSRDHFALHEILQWAFRGSCRAGNKMVLAIASVRMYNLVYNYLHYGIVNDSTQPSSKYKLVD